MGSITIVCLMNSGLSLIGAWRMFSLICCGLCALSMILWMFCHTSEIIPELNEADLQLSGTSLNPLLSNKPGDKMHVNRVTF